MNKIREVLYTSRTQILRFWEPSRSPQHFAAFVIDKTLLQPETFSRHYLLSPFLLDRVLKVGSKSGYFCNIFQELTFA